MNDFKTTICGVELKDFEESLENVELEEGMEKRKKFYAFKEGLQILFISEQEFRMMKNIGKARFIKYADSDRIILFNEDCIRHFFDDANTDKIVAEIHARARERWFIAKEAVEKTSSLLGW
jgi:hypothetical protein